VGSGLHFCNITKYFLKTNKVGLWWFSSIFVTVWSLHKLAHNVLQIGAGRDFNQITSYEERILKSTTFLSYEAETPA
jgi:hypothetical protein